nr:potassium-transporting ATPase subunit KdpC [Nakamurella aerolata]
MVSEESTSTSSGAAGAAGMVAGRQLLIAVRFLLAMTLLLGVLYPAAIFGIGRLLPGRADGSLVADAGGRIVGSSLIGQSFDGPEWFTPRPSAAGDGYDAMASGGSNLGASNDELAAEITRRRADIARVNGVRPEQVPADAVTASGSGLDPDISPAYARLQAPRVAQARGLEVEAVRQLVTEQVTGRPLGILGSERVNVLQLNLALQRLAARDATAG